MYKLKCRKSLCFLIAIILTVDINIYALNNIEDEINSNNETIEELEREQQEIKEAIKTEEESLQSIEKDINKKREEVLKAKSDVEAFQSEINIMQNEIDQIDARILESELEIAKAEENISIIVKEQKKQEELLANRIRNYYKFDIGNQYIYMILNSESIFDFFSQLININRLMKIDRELLESKKQKEVQLNDEKEFIKEALLVQEEDKRCIEEKQKDLIEVQKDFVVIKEKEEKEMFELQALENNKNNLIAMLQSEEETLNNQIEDLLSYNKELQDKLDDIFEDLENGSDEEIVIPDIGVSNGFLRPVNGVITCEYGPRINPVTFQPGFHNGIDYAGNTGEAIVATKSGVVEYSGWIEGYGNTIILNHGDGVKSLYAHASELTVLVGQTVNQGETVALIGSTGMSTGPHLHFEIRINGQTVNPFDYIPY